MATARNADPMHRIHAVLDLVERVVRHQEGSVSPSDRRFMQESFAALGSDLEVLQQQASALWSAPFGRVLSSAHSMRCVRVDCKTKGRKRQHQLRCDACGRNEEYCGFAIDLGGGKHNSADWHGARGNLRSAWTRFLKDYRADVEGESDDGLADSDLGRYYVGRTCCRKALLHFVASTMCCDAAYNAYAQVQAAGVGNEEARLVSVDEDAVAAFSARLEQLKSCIANEQSQDMPAVLVDEEWWGRVDRRREAAAGRKAGGLSALLRERARSVLRPTEAVEAEQLSEDEDEGGEEEDDEFIVESDHNGEAGELGLDDESDDEARVGRTKRRGSAPRGKVRRVIFDDGDDCSGEDEAAEACAHVLTTRMGSIPLARPGGRNASAASAASAAPQPAQRRSNRLRNMHPRVDLTDPPDEAAAQPERDDAAVGGNERAQASEQARVEVAHTARRPPPTAAQIARGMRIPRSGAAPALESRRAVLLGLMEVQRQLVVRRDDALAASVSAAVITMQELIELVERTRGSGSGSAS